MAGKLHKLIVVPPADGWCEVLYEAFSGGTRRWCVCGWCWPFVVRLAIKLSAVFSFLYAAPLFEEEEAALCIALLLNCAYPGWVHGSCAWSAFASDDHPVNAGQVKLAKVFKQRLDAKEAHSRERASQASNSWDAVLLVFDTNTPPDVGCTRSLFEFRRKKLLKSVSALGEDLVGVPVRFQHNVCYGFYVVIGNGVLEEVAHAVHENNLGVAPAKRLDEFLRHEPRVEAVFVWVSGDVAESLGECFCVTVLASWADFQAAPDGIPGCFGPLDLGLQAHRVWLLVLLHFGMKMFYLHHTWSATGLETADLRCNLFAIRR